MGFGDPTSIRLIQDVIKATQECGAIRHGSECFNWGLPQEMEDDFLVVWDGFDDKPWRYKTQEQLLEFLLTRCNEGFSFPLHPGWDDVYNALENSPAAQQSQDAWFPKETKIREK